MEEYISQLVDNFIIATWAGIISGLIVYKKLQKEKGYKIIVYTAKVLLIGLIILFSFLIIAYPLIMNINSILILLILAIFLTLIKIVGLSKSKTTPSGLRPSADR